MGVLKLLASRMELDILSCKRHSFHSTDSTCQYWLKLLAELVEHVHGLLEDGATMENTLLIDHTSYKNIKNNHYSVVYPPICILY